MTQATMKSLISYKNEIDWFDINHLYGGKGVPFSQGIIADTVIKQYKIPAIRWGYNGSLVGVETKKQIMIWRDKGAVTEFKGIINKSEIDPAIEAKIASKPKINMNTKLFTNENINDVMDQVRNGLKFPYIDVHGSTFDRDNFYITISIQPKSEWNYGYLNNSKHITISVDQNRKIEAVKNSGLKFRGFRAKSIEEVIEKVNKITEK